VLLNNLTARYWTALWYTRLITVADGNAVGINTAPVTLIQTLFKMKASFLAVIS